MIKCFFNIIIFDLSVNRVQISLQWGLDAEILYIVKCGSSAAKEDDDDAKRSDVE